MLNRLQATSRLLRALAIAAVAPIMALASTTALLADEYRLGVQDKLRIRVVEWQTIDGTFREWTAVSGEYTVSASGTLSIPFIGEAPAEGKTTGELSKTIADTLQRKFGLADRPEASVELAAYRPIYISGDAQTPGQYPFAPGLTVIKAVSLAGGARNGLGLRTERDYITAKGNYDTFAAERTRLLVRSARLSAEAEGKTEITLPESVRSAPDVGAIVADEMAIMNARQRKLALQLKALQDLRDLLGKQIVSLEKKASSQKRQMELAQAELKGVDSLADKGLVSSTRVLNAERAIADIEGRDLDLETSILRARQDISVAEQDEINLTNTMASDIAIERQRVEADLVEVALKLDTYHALMAEALQAGSSTKAAEMELSTTYTLVRDVNGSPQDIPATEATAVLPGDVVKVRNVLPGSASEIEGQ